MNPTGTSGIMAILAATTIGGCAVVGPSSVVIPPDARLDRISIHKETFPGLEESDPSVPDKVIVDRDQLDRIAAFLVAHGRGWRQPWETLGSRYWIRIEGSQGVPHHLFYSTAWIWDGRRVKYLNVREQGEFRALLGLESE